LIFLVISLFVTYNAVLAADQANAAKGAVHETGTTENKIVHENKAAVSAVNDIKNEKKPETAEEKTHVIGSHSEITVLNSEKKAVESPNPAAGKAAVPKVTGEVQIPVNKSEIKIEHEKIKSAKEEVKVKEPHSQPEVKKDLNVARAVDKRHEKKAGKAISAKKHSKKQHYGKKHSKKSRRGHSKKAEYPAENIYAKEVLQSDKTENVLCDENITVIKVRSDAGITNEYRITNFDKNSAGDMESFLAWLNAIMPSKNYQIIFK